MNYDQYQVALGTFNQLYENQCRQANSYARGDKAVKHLVDERYAELEQFCDVLDMLEANTSPAWLFAVHLDLKLLQAKDPELTGALIQVLFRPGTAQLAYLNYELYA